MSSKPTKISLELPKAKNLSENRLSVFQRLGNKGSRTKKAAGEAEQKKSSSALVAATTKTTTITTTSAQDKAAAAAASIKAKLERQQRAAANKAEKPSASATASTIMEAKKKEVRKVRKIRHSSTSSESSSSSGSSSSDSSSSSSSSSPRRRVKHRGVRKRPAGDEVKKVVRKKPRRKSPDVGSSKKVVKKSKNEMLPKIIVRKTNTPPRGSPKPSLKQIKVKVTNEKQRLSRRDSRERSDRDFYRDRSRYKEKPRGRSPSPRPSRHHSRSPRLSPRRDTRRYSGDRHLSPRPLYRSRERSLDRSPYRGRDLSPARRHETPKERERRERKEYEIAREKERAEALARCQARQRERERLKEQMRKSGDGRHDDRGRLPERRPLSPRRGRSRSYSRERSMALKPRLDYDRPERDYDRSPPGRDYDPYLRERAPPRPLPRYKDEEPLPSVRDYDRGLDDWEIERKRMYEAERGDWDRGPPPSHAPPPKDVYDRLEPPPPYGREKELYKYPDPAWDEIDRSPRAAMHLKKYPPEWQDCPPPPPHAVAPYRPRPHLTPRAEPGPYRRPLHPSHPRSTRIRGGRGGGHYPRPAYHPNITYFPQRNKAPITATTSAAPAPAPATPAATQTAPTTSAVGQEETKQAEPTAAASTSPEDVSKGIEEEGDNLSEISDGADEILEQPDAAALQSATATSEGQETPHDEPEDTPSDTKAQANKQLQEEMELDFEEISDGELEEENKLKSVGDALGVDWASLVEESRRRVKQTTAAHESSAKQRWQPHRVFLDVGVSARMAGEAFAASLLRDACSKLEAEVAAAAEVPPIKDEVSIKKEVVEEDEEQREAPAAEENKSKLDFNANELIKRPFGFAQTAYLRRLRERKALIANATGLNCRALSARQDLAIRRTLCDLPKEELHVAEGESKNFDLALSMFKKAIGEAC